MHNKISQSESLSFNNLVSGVCGLPYLACRFRKAGIKMETPTPPPPQKKNNKTKQKQKKTTTCFSINKAIKGWLWDHSTDRKWESRFYLRLFISSNEVFNTAYAFKILSTLTIPTLDATTKFVILTI